MGASVGWQGTSRAHGYATLREMTRTSETKLRRSRRVLTSHRRSAAAAPFFPWEEGHRHRPRSLIVGVSGPGAFLRFAPPAPGGGARAPRFRPLSPPLARG